MNAKRNHQKNRNGKKSKRQDALSLQIMRSANNLRGPLMASESDIALVFSQVYLLGNATGYNFAYALRTNAAYDVDPALGSTATQGLTEMSSFYNYYRVIGYRGQVECTNQNAIPVICTVGHTNINYGIGSGGTAVNLFAVSGNPNFYTHTLTHAYGNEAQWVHKFDKTISQVVGSPAPETEDNFRALVASVPTDLTYILFGVTSVGTTTAYELANNVAFTVRLEMVIRFYDRTILAS